MRQRLTPVNFRNACARMLMLLRKASVNEARSIMSVLCYAIHGNNKTPPVFTLQATFRVKLRKEEPAVGQAA